MFVLEEKANAVRVTYVIHDVGGRKHFVLADLLVVDYCCFVNIKINTPEDLIPPELLPSWCKLSLAPKEEFLVDKDKLVEEAKKFILNAPVFL